MMEKFYLVTDEDREKCPHGEYSKNGVVTSIGSIHCVQNCKYCTDFGIENNTYWVMCRYLQPIVI